MFLGQAKKNRIVSRCSLAFLCLVLPQGPVSAQSLFDLGCSLEAGTETQSVRQVPIDNSWSGTSFDGGRGTDTIIRLGPDYFVPRPEKIVSVEVINTKNGQFDTIVVNGLMIVGAENRELEIVADWFDQIILDPMLTWDSTISPAFDSRIFRTEAFRRPVMVRTELDAYVVDAPQMSILTREGPLGRFLVQHSSDLIVNLIAATADQLGSIELIWNSTGLVTPSFEGFDEPFELVTLNTRNQTPNAIVIDAVAMSGTTPRQVVFDGDELDRLIILQSPCWKMSELDQNGQRTAVFNEGMPNELSFRADQQHFQTQRTGSFTQAVAEIPSYRHLSADSRHTIDSINMRNGSRDVLIIRNDQRLRRGFPVIIDGDPDLDEIWIEGAVGWRTELHDFGLVATVPAGAKAELVLAFAPGLKVGTLRLPPFLNDPRMFKLTAYPGLRDEQTRSTGLNITRGGFINFSANQLANKTILDLTNGTENVLRLNPDNLKHAGTDVLIKGDATMDVILSDGMPELVPGPSGSLTWKIDRLDGQIQTITATGIAYVQYPVSK